MSKVAIKGNASGTGTFTLEAPNSNTDRVLTLPDEAGTVLTSGGAIDLNASAPADSVAIDSSGNVGIGTSSPSNKLVVSQSNTGDNACRINSTNSGFTANVLRLSCENGSGASFNFLRCDQQSTSIKCFIRGNGDLENNNNNYGAISDQNLKENIVNASSQWEDIKALQVRKYSFIEDNLDTPNQIGVIAQELESSGMTGLVKNYEAEFWEEGDELPEGVSVGDVKQEAYKTVKYSILYMKAVKALQEAIGRIETLEAEVATLKGASA